MTPAIEALESRTLFATYTASTAAELITAMNAANKSSKADVITLAPGATFSLAAVHNTTNGATGLPTIGAKGGSLTIVGNGAIIERSAAAGTPAFRLLDVAPNAALTLSALVLQGGLARGGGSSAAPPAQGGGIYNRGNLTLSSVTIRNNTAQGPDSFIIYGAYRAPAGNAAGGGIFSTGTLNATDCTIHENLAVGGRGWNSMPYVRSMPGNGGSPYPALPGGHATGGGVHLGAGSANIMNSTFTGNTAQGGAGGSGDVYAAWTTGGAGGNGFGGAIYAGEATLTVRNMSVTANNALRGLAGLSAAGKPKATPGTGIGGGLYFDVAASAGLDTFTRNHVSQNIASDTSNNIAGTFSVLA